MRPAECHSVGWLVKENEDFIVLATNVAPDWKNEDLGILVAIPNCVVKKIVDQVDTPEDRPRPYPDWADEPGRCRICGSVCCDANHDYDPTDLE